MGPLVPCMRDWPWTTLTCLIFLPLFVEKQASSSLLLVEVLRFGGLRGVSSCLIVSAASGGARLWWRHKPS